MTKRIRPPRSRTPAAPTLARIVRLPSSSGGGNSLAQTKLRRQLARARRPK